LNKDFLIILSGRLLQVLISLIAIRALTTLLSVEEVGNYYILLAILAFFNLVLLNPPGVFFARNLLHWNKSQNLLNALFVFALWILIVAIVSIPISKFLFVTLGYETKFDADLFLAYVFAAILVSTIHRNSMYGVNTLGHRKKFVIYLISTLLLGLTLSVSIAYLYYDLALGWLIGGVLSELLTVFVIIKFFIHNSQLSVKKVRKTLNEDKIKKILIFCLPIGLTTFLMWGQNTAYRFIVDYSYSAEVLGYLSIGLGISSAIFASLESILMQYFNPIFLKNILDSSRNERALAWNNIAKQVVPIYIVTTFFVIAMSEVLINLLADEKFLESYVYIMIGALIEFFRVMTSLLINVSQSEYKTTGTVAPYTIGFLVSIVTLSLFDFGSNVFMIPIVLSFAYFMVFVLMYKNMKKVLDIKYDFDFFKLVLFSIPFFVIYLVDYNKVSLLSNLAMIILFGLYYLYLIWQISIKHLLIRKGF